MLGLHRLEGLASESSFTLIATVLYWEIGLHGHGKLVSALPIVRQRSLGDRVRQQLLVRCLARLHAVRHHEISEAIIQRRHAEKCARELDEQVDGDPSLPALKSPLLLLARRVIDWSRATSKPQWPLGLKGSVITFLLNKPSNLMVAFAASLLLALANYRPYLLLYLRI